MAIRKKPGIPSAQTKELRKALIKEEYEELMKAIDEDNIVEIADGIADMHYVLSGTSVSYGIPEDATFKEVHRSNMSKVWEDGTVHRREDGKILKPPTYSPADIQKTLEDSLVSY